jgi:hypothetical protein
MADSKTYKVIVIFEDGVPGACGAIDFEGAIWLVPKWLPFPNEGYTKPERMIRLDQFQNQKFDPPAKGPGPFAGADFGINGPLPKMLFFGELTQQLKSKYVVLDRPDVKFRTGGTLS